jgi:photosystem II stability/assembly factor-like uncharacterized protein
MRFFLFLLFISFQGYAQQFTLKELTAGTNTSLRGLSVVSDSVAWVSGSNGYVGKTLDGGATWIWTQPKGYERLDFRDVEAFDGQRAIVVNAGSPAFILLTVDGGQSWSEQYLNRDSAIFLDGMSFWDEQNGIIFGDPIKNRMQLLKTADGGKRWEDISSSLKTDLKLGEAGFAASGSSIKTGSKGQVWIATGGSVSHIYFSKNYGKSWAQYACPIIQGENSTGAFSIDFIDANNGVVVGGNYLMDQDHSNNILLTKDAGKSWVKPRVPVFGYRSSVAYLDKNTCVAVGSSGIDFSNDAGLSWQQLSNANFNAVQKAKKGKLVLLTGNKGQICRLN